MSEVLRRLLRDRQVDVDDWFDGRGEESHQSELDWDVASRRNLVEGLRGYGVQAQFQEELVVRLIGGVASRGALDLELTSLLDGVRRSFAEGSSVNLALTAIASGSTVLHFRPRELDAGVGVGGPDGVPVDATPADAAGRDFVALVAAAERGEDVRRWTAMFRGLEQAVGALESQDLDAEVAWMSLAGSITEARLTGPGRAYVRSLSDVTPNSHDTVVSGRVVELRETGRVKLKTGRAINAPVHEVLIASDVLLRMHIELGMTVHLLVKRTVERDHLGRESTPTLEFVRRLDSHEAAEMLPGFDSEEF